jgi:hypothetical protein
LLILSKRSSYVVNRFLDSMAPSTFTIDNTRPSAYIGFNPADDIKVGPPLAYAPGVCKRKKEEDYGL